MNYTVIETIKSISKWKHTIEADSEEEAIQIAKEGTEDSEYLGVEPDEDGDYEYEVEMSK